MKMFVRMFLLMGAVSCRNLSNRGEGEGFNPGQSDFNPGDQQNGGSGYNAGDQQNGGSGYNAGDQQNGGSGYNAGDQHNGGSGYNAGDQQNGGSGYNAGDQPNGGSGYNSGDQQNGGSGFNAGDQQNNQFNPQIPDFIPDESITNSGSSGFNSGRDNSLSLGSARPNSRPDPSGRPDAHPNINSGFNPAVPGLSGFRTPIIFAEEEEEDQSEGEMEEEQPVILLQSYPGYYPLIQALPSGLVSASTLPAGVKAPYVPGTNKQQYVRGVQRQSFYPLIQRPGGFVGAQTLPAQIVFAGEEKEDYVPGSNKQQYLRGRFSSPQYVPLLKTSNPLTGGSAETLPSPIVFAPAEKAPYVPGTNKQQYLRGRQTKPALQPEYRPLVHLQTADSVPVQSLPAGLVFPERAAYVPGASKEQYLRNNVAAQTLPSPITFASEEEPDNFVLLTPRRVTRPAPAARQPFLRAAEEDQPTVYPGVSSRPSFPPGFRPRQYSTYSQAAPDGGYEGPKNVLYFF